MRGTLYGLEDWKAGVANVVFSIMYFWPTVTPKTNISYGTRYLPHILSPFNRLFLFAQDAMNKNIKISERLPTQFDYTLSYSVRFIQSP